MIYVALTNDEREVLSKENTGRGGFQGLFVKLQQKMEGRLVPITPDDLERIQRYAFDYGNGGWEARLTAIFGRAFGPTLGRNT